MTKKEETLRNKVEKEVVYTKAETGTRKRKKSYVMDLRVHTPASAGYFGIEGIDTAPALVSLAKVKGLDLIAVTDFYSGAFIDPIMEAANGSSLSVIPGTNLRCRIGACDEVVLTCLFPENFRSTDVENFLRRMSVPAQARGHREFVVMKSISEIISDVESMNGVIMPSRMDQTPHRMSVVPALVEDYGFRTFDLAYPDSAAIFKKRWPKIKFNLFSFSNANSLAQLGTRTARVKLPELDFASIRTMTQREMVEKPGAA